MAMVTYSDESPLHIRKGDLVHDRKNGRYTADSDAVVDQWNDINVMNGDRWVTYAQTDTVTLTFEEISEGQYV